MERLGLEEIIATVDARRAPNDVRQRRTATLNSPKLRPREYRNRSRGCSSGHRFGRTMRASPSSRRRVPLSPAARRERAVAAPPRRPSIPAKAQAEELLTHGHRAEKRRPQGINSSERRMEMVPRKSTLAALLGASAVTRASTGAAFAGEVTGNGKPTAGPSHANSICVFSGHNDDPTAPLDGSGPNGPGGPSQSYGQENRLGSGRPP